MAETDPGTVLAGKYRVERVLGTGGMGVVVAAVHEQLDERVAIKLLRPDRAAQADAVERALREARATVKIQSEHVVRVFDCGTLESGAPYIVMEYLAGCDLAQLLCAEGKLDIADAASYVRQACDAVAKAHAIGIVHRDLKPANLFLAVRDDRSAIKVLDFGISKFVATGEHRVDAALTTTASVLGSPAYMSPEQLESPRDIDGRTDVWSLGVILFELLTGAHPFVADTLPQLYKKIIDTPAPSVRALRSDVPPELDAIVARCLAKQASDRFADVAALAAALAPFAIAADPRKVAALAETAAASRDEIQSARLASQPGDTPLAGAILRAIAHTQQPHGRRRIRALAAAGSLAALAAGTVVFMRTDKASHGANRSPAAGKAAPAATHSPLAVPGSVLACPQLAVRGDDHGGWLGAAASTIACTRASVRMGGHSERALRPAELLDLPRAPVDNFPEDVFVQAGARDKEIAAARQRGQAWLDGEIEHHDDDFAITLVLRAGDTELARGTAHDATLVGAIRGAMQPLAAQIPAAPDDDPYLREWVGARTAAGAEAMVDWSISVRLESPGKQACDETQDRTDLLPFAKHVIANWCAPTFVDSPDRDTSSPGALVASIQADGQLRHRPLADDIARLDAALAKTTDRQGRSILLAAKAGVYSAHRDYAAATQTALAAIDADPKAFTPWDDAWDVLSWVRASSNAAPAAVAWTPWNTEVYCFAAMRSPAGTAAIEYSRRGVVLSHDQVWKENLVEFLLEGKRFDEAAAAAAKIPEDPVQVLVAASDGHLARATDLGQRMMKSDDAYVAFYAAQELGQIDLLLGRRTQGIDALVTKFLAAKPSKITMTILEISVALACANAEKPTARKCFSLLREQSGGNVFYDENFLTGAERFADEDYAGAARAWRQLVAKPDWHFAMMHDMLAIALDRSGDPDNAARVDAPYVEHAGRFNGAEPAHAREALRAEKRGDTARARELAKKVIDAWSTADIDVPAVAEMRKLVTRLDRRDREQHDHTR